MIYDFPIAFKEVNPIHVDLKFSLDWQKDMTNSFSKQTYWMRNWLCCSCGKACRRISVRAIDLLRRWMGDKNPSLILFDEQQTVRKKHESSRWRNLQEWKPELTQQAALLLMPYEWNSDPYQDQSYAADSYSWLQWCHVGGLMPQESTGNNPAFPQRKPAMYMVWENKNQLWYYN